MRKIFVSLMLAIFLATNASAFLYDVEILEQKSIEVLTDADLETKYVDTMIHKEAVDKFVEKNGFSSEKDFLRYKSLLKYLFLLQQEKEKRRVKNETQQKLNSASQLVE